MSYYRRLIEESEKKRILGLHNKNRKNPTTGLLKEALTDFPSCVRYAAGGKEEVTEQGGKFIRVSNGAGKGKDYLWFSDRSVWVWDNNFKNNAGEIGGYTKFPDGSDAKRYHCKCVNGKCTPQTFSSDEEDRPDECDEKKTCSTQQGSQQGTAPGGQTGGDCSKGPMDLAVSMGLNWKETRQKWIDAKCNGTTPCILGDPTTNINLRNALCKGTWNPKTGGGTQTGDQPSGQPSGQTGGQTGDQPSGESKFIEPIFPGAGTSPINQTGGQSPKAD
jgi:hypothetical protein